MWEISENLHRADLTVLERSEHVAEWVRLTDGNKGATCADIPRGRGQPEGGINAAVRELGIERTEAQRAVKIDKMPDEAKAAARAAGLDDNQSALIAAARAPDPVAKVAEISADRAARAAQRARDKEEAHRRNMEADRDIARGIADEFAEWLMARTDLRELPTVISWLEGAKPREVIAALRRMSA